MAKRIIYTEKARAQLKAGIDKVADTVKLTLGPRGRNIALGKSWGGPTITNDGVSIAKEITLKDTVENMGAEIAKEVATKTNDAVGDGTTTSIVLFQAMVNDGLKRISLGANPTDVREGMMAAAHDATGLLQTMSKSIKSKAEVAQVATISAESAELGEKIAEVIETVGQDGVVTVEESHSFGIETEVLEGLEFDKGYVSAYMITNAERMEAEMKDVPILLTDKKISTVKEILPLLEKLAAAGRKELFIVADDVDGEALTTFVLNKLRGAFTIIAVKAPGYGDRKKEMLQDIAVTVGATVVSDDVGLKLESVEATVLGRAQRVVVKKDSTVIVGGKGKKAEIEERVRQLKKQASDSDSKFDKEKIEERIAKLTGGVAVIRVGAATETEMKYLKDKIEDAVNATKAAIAEGIVPGGGTALVRLGGALNKKLKEKTYAEKGDAFAAGYATVMNACLAPLQEIIRNTTHDVGVDSAILVTKVVEEGMGFNAKTREAVPDMVKAGIIDPVKVTRTALMNAASAAAVFLTTDAVVADEPEEKKEVPGANPGMGMDY